jgi:hypothetical protein
MRGPVLDHIPHHRLSVAFISLFRCLSKCSAGITLRKGGAMPANMIRTREQPIRLQLPRFLVPGIIGLGRVLRGLTTSLGIPACPACERRSAALDRLVEFAPFGRDSPPAPRPGCWFAGTNCYGFIQTLKFCCGDGQEYTVQWGWCIGVWFAPPCRFGPDQPPYSGDAR